MGTFAGLARTLAIVSLTLAPSLALAKTSAPAPAAKTAKAKKARTPYVAPGFLAPHYSSIVVDADTGRVLSEADADSPTHPASLTKMMTLYLLFGALERGEVRMSTPMKVSKFATTMGPSKLGVQAGKTLTVDQAIDAIITKSANDVAVVIAERIGGTEARFAEKMTTTARRIGMSSTSFHNASGLPDPDQITTARDMAVLGKRLMQDFPQYYPLFSRMDFAYGAQTIRGHNHLLEFYEGADGIKTGYTAASGFNLVGSAKRGEHRLIAVVLGGKSAYARDRHMADLMDDGFEVMSGHPERAVAGRHIESFKNMQVAAAVHQNENEAESAGDRDEPNVMAALRPGVVQTEALPPAPPSHEAPVPAPVLKAENSPPMRARIIQDADDAPVSIPIPGGKALTKDSTAVAAQKRAATAPATKETKVASLPRTPVNAKADGWGIQVGAFSSSTAAQAQAEAAVAKLKSAYAAATAVVERVSVKGKAMYRARVHGLPQTELTRACAIVGKQVKGACKAVTPDAQKAQG